jgi:hypothetical protein
VQRNEHKAGSVAQTLRLNELKVTGIWQVSGVIQIHCFANGHRWKQNSFRNTINYFNVNFK